ncbi:MAG: murein transglycosylase A [Rhodocyclales bacterium]|nr:murein transglycosylase A [Rhodocyclales bacterium]
MVFVLSALLSACSGKPAAPEPTPEPPACPQVQPCPACPVCPTIATATPDKEPPAQAPALQRATWQDLPEWSSDDLTQAWPALRASCQTISKQPRWSATCKAAETLSAKPTSKRIREFVETWLEPWQATNPDGTTEGLVTGYYEPLIKGSRSRSATHAWPVFGPPADMLTIDLGDAYPELKHMRLRGRLVENKVVPYFTRAEIDTLGDRIPAPTLLWAADPIDLFFLQVQGSGQVELDDGTRIRIGYADQNGHPYQSIGRWLVAQGELALDQASMQGIKSWAQAHPQRLAEMLNTNPSYVFFRELPASGDGPTGALGVPLTANRSIAVDPRHIPLGAPVFLATTYPLSDKPLNRLVLAQDTGSAIKGVVRADYFWGFGADSGARAGKMRQPARMWVLLPKEPTS